MTDDERLIERAKRLSRAVALTDEVRDTLYMVATLAEDRGRDLRFLIGQLGALTELATRSAETSGLMIARGRPAAG